MSPDQRKLREAADYIVSYTLNGEIYSRKFRTKEGCDDFAETMSLMGATEISKSYWDSLVRKWLPYTKEIFRTENL